MSRERPGKAERARHQDDVRRLTEAVLTNKQADAIELARRLDAEQKLREQQRQERKHG